jgi:3-phosphoinositide dependent protein kinase-1
MHLLVADFGSAKILPDDYDYEGIQKEIEQSRNIESDDETTPARRQRRISFVGTAQYVSPEVLNGDAPHPAMDLFSYGSIIYQMLCGTFAFNAANEYLTFQKINKLDYEIPSGELKKNL